ncbi:hypothetical protein M0R72_11665 [Candidatus Pacearchaeota archaeon]|jgi:hypothetical protein|nr:hypothetical protein [Candidatus Pacearchaeota archaeon]
MSRFHEEFFRQGSPVHDALMIKCVSEEGINEIVNQIGLRGWLLDEIAKRQQEVVVCSHGQGHSAHRGDHAPKTELRTFWTDYLCNERATERCCSLKDECKNVDTCKWFLEGQKAMSVCIKEIPFIKGFTSTFETEVIVNNGNFIVGYADAIVKIKFQVLSDAEIGPEWIWRGYSESTYDVALLIEAKPKLNSVGDTLRQLKTYRSLVGYKIGCVLKPVIVTYSKLDKATVDFIGNEDVLVATFSEGAA